ncbi:unnamed protein product [Prorocentrum cordatum]|uniref:3-deoxy-7-phosphoheptulonate synthase n=1 Tax=Prorocentrum cordatum TaxID=2364126 RepID=A0ABN9VUQ8_9DINO|nr:unnamed protein product [Polarella glacialis]
MGGDRDVLEQFPGLEWLAEPVNDELEFIDELRRSRPNLVFRGASGNATEPAGAASAGAPGAAAAAAEPGGEPRLEPAAGEGAGTEGAASAACGAAAPGARRW